ncbi:ATP-binding protein [Malonomonas rubra]|uniref:ATP-binding protein n=1 Tax=Malonomonas rubra TaxID=57040 RepID=UPI0026EDC783|nr:ATP-binding protein [Malonomonas rubra]
MRSLFVKFFFSFLLINILFVAIALTLTFLRDQEFPPEAHQQFARQMIKDYGFEAISKYEAGGSQELYGYTQQLYKNRRVRLSLYDAEGRLLTEQLNHMPRRMQMMARRALQERQIVFPMRGERNWVAGSLTTSKGRTYAVAIGLPEKPRPEQLLKGLTRGFLGWRLLMLLAISALVCLWLARSFSAPISRLRKATRQFAAGELSIRVGEQVRGKHEIGGLARDFDDMAERIEGLIAGQQQLFRDISHELRSPLARLGVALELARQEGAPEAKQRALQRIELEAERMNEMIGQLLSLTRLESGARKLDRHAFDLTEMLADLVHDADFEARNRGCRVTFSGDGPLLYFGSQELLARAVENVIRNAVKYTAEDSVVAVELLPSAQSIRLRIVDQGPGVPEESLAKLFEPFYRVAYARERQSGGTGIGLAIADRSVRLHGGSIKAENHPHGGLIVEIVLPRMEN